MKLNKIFVALLLAILFTGHSLFAQSVVWSGWYNGRYYAPKTYSVDRLCCNNPRCAMRSSILGMIAAEQARQAVTVTKPREVKSKPVPKVEGEYRIETRYREVEKVRKVTKYRKKTTWQRKKVCHGSYCTYEMVPVVTTEPYVVNETYKVREPYTVKVLIEKPKETPGEPPKVKDKEGEFKNNGIEPPPMRKPGCAQLPDWNPLADPTLDPSPIEAVKAMLDIVQPQPSDIVMDIGCGDGRILIEAAKNWGAKAIGVEINPETVKQARNKVQLAGVSDRVAVLEGDALEQDLHDATIVTLYVFPQLAEKLWPKIRTGTLVVSYSHELPVPSRKVEKDGYEFYVAFKS